MSARVCETMKFMEQFRFRDGLRGSAFIGEVVSIPIHMHDGPELMYVLKGELELQISFHRHQLKAGEFFLVNSYEAHSVKGKDAAEILFLQMDQGLFTGKKFAYDPYFYESCKQKAVKEIKEHMIDSYLLSATKLQKQETEESMRKIASLCDRFLRIETGGMIQQMQQAELLLLGTEMPVQQVGKKAGFPTHACFVKHFKESFKMAPSAFRQKYSGQVYPKEERICRRMVYAPSELTEVARMLERRNQEQYLKRLGELLEEAGALCDLMSEDRIETEKLQFSREEKRTEIRLKETNAVFATQEDDKSA